MNILEILDEDLIDINVDLKSKDEVIRFLSNKLYKKGNIENLEEFIKSVYERESVGETGMCNGIAIPHGISEYVKIASFAVVKLNNPIEWESLDDVPIDLIFLLAITNNNSERSHLMMLSQLSSILAYKENIEELRKCDSSSEFLNKFGLYFEKFSKSQ